jgi:hypothetical protein
MDCPQQAGMSRIPLGSVQLLALDRLDTTKLISRRWRFCRLSADLRHTQGYIFIGLGHCSAAIVPTSKLSIGNWSPHTFAYNTLSKIAAKMAPLPLRALALLLLPTLIASSPVVARAPGYQVCGGFSPDPPLCPDGYSCIDNPLSEGCGMRCHMPGICVKLCGGYAGIQCPKGYSCVDDPTDDCDPNKGGFDCGGICILNAD